VIDTPRWLALARQRQGWICEHRRYLHQHPELSFKEQQTCQYIFSILEQMGLRPEIVAGTGVIATIGSGDRCVALRADIDALPITEQTGLPYASVNAGVMHACGHDCHTAMLLGAASLLHEHADALGGRVLVIFQPGEEKAPGGASLIIKDGVLERFAPEAIFGQHLFPEAPTGTIEIATGPIMASADELYWSLRGKGTHAAEPEKGSNPIRVAAELIVHMESIIQHYRNPLDPGLLAVTAVVGGTATNVIPDRVELKGTLRSFNERWRREMWNRITSHSKLLCSLHDVECTLEIAEGYPPLVNDKMASEHAQAVASALLSSVNVRPFKPKLWAEDFAFYAERIPAAFWMLGCRSPEQSVIPGLHSPFFAPDEEALPIGTALLCAIAAGWFARQP